MKAAKEYDGWIKVKNMRDINAQMPKNNDLVWHPGLCSHQEIHPTACKHFPITLKEFWRQRKRKDRIKLSKVYFCKNDTVKQSIWTRWQMQVQQNIAIIANFIVLLIITAYILIDFHYAIPPQKISSNSATVIQKHTTTPNKVTKDSLSNP